MITCKNNFGEMVTLPKEKFQFRPSVYGIIKNKGKICICRNKSNGKIWFPGGGIDVGERRIEALIREIKEETGLEQVKIGNLLGVFEIFFTTNQLIQRYMRFYSFTIAQLRKMIYCLMTR